MAELAIGHLERERLAVLMARYGDAPTAASWRGALVADGVTATAVPGNLLWFSSWKGARYNSMKSLTASNPANHAGHTRTSDVDTTQHCCPEMQQDLSAIDQLNAIIGQPFHSVSIRRNACCCSCHNMRGRCPLPALPIAPHPLVRAWPQYLPESFSSRALDT